MRWRRHSAHIVAGPVMPASLGTANDGRLPHRACICWCGLGLGGRRLGRGVFGDRSRREDKSCGHSKDQPMHSFLHACCCRFSVTMTGVPITDPRRMPFVRPAIRGHDVGLGATPNIGPQSCPRIIPDRPLIPLPILPWRPSARAFPIADDHTVAAPVLGDGRPFGRHSMAHGCNGRQQSGHGKGLQNGSIHAWLLGAPAAGQKRRRESASTPQRPAPFADTSLQK
jgi:hypothetical protein